MKKISKNLIRAMCVALCFLALVFQTSASDPKWFGNDHFKISKNDDLVKVSMKKLPFESFSVNLEELESNDGFISFEVKSEKKIRLKVDGFTSEGSQINLFDEEVSAGHFEKLFYNLSESQYAVKDLIFYINPGEKFNGEVLFKGLKISPFLEGGKTLSLFPNPTSDRITVNLPDEQFEKVSIYDLQGRLILEKPVVQSSVEADLNGQKAGIYMIKAKGPDATLTQRFMVK